MITDNSANEGAGIYAPWVITFEVENSHFEGNVAAQGGSAISFPHGRAHIAGSTFVDNEGAGAAMTMG